MVSSQSRQFGTFHLIGRYFQEYYTSFQILEFDGGFGSTSCLFHDGEFEDLVSLTVNFYSEAVLDVRCINATLRAVLEEIAAVAALWAT